MTIKTGSSAGRIDLVVRRLAFVLALCLGTAACDDSAVIWKAQLKSPDGRWFALANIKQYGGPGQDALLTQVSLVRSDSDNKDKDTVEVLLLSDQRVPMAYVQMNWLSPKHLEIVYTRENEIDFQAIKCAGLDISLRAVDYQLPENTY